MGFKAWWNKHKYSKYGVLIGLIVGLLDSLLILITSMSGKSFMLTLNYIPLFFIYPIIESNTKFFGEAHVLMAWFIILLLLIIFYLMIGGIVGLIIDKLKK